MRAAVVLALVGGLAIGGAAFAWTLLDATAPPLVHLPAAVQPVEVLPEPAVVHPDETRQPPAPAPPGPGSGPSTTAPGSVGPTSSAPPNPSEEEPVPSDPGPAEPVATSSGQGAATGREAVRNATCVTDGWHCRTFEWQFEGVGYWLVMELDPRTAQAYRDEAKPYRLQADADGTFVRVPAYDIYVSDPRDDAFIGALAAELHRLANATGLTTEQELSFVLAFVQGLTYTSDEVTTGFDEYPRHPFETLVDEGGDCEDTSILYASLVLALGMDAVLLAPPRHMAVGVASAAEGDGMVVGDVRYLYAETTGDGWPIGVVPPEMAGPMESWSLEPKPLLSFGTVQANGEGSGLRVRAPLANLGSVAGSALIVARLESPAGEVLSAANCPQQLDPRQEGSCALFVDASPVARGQQVRLVVDVTAGGTLHDRVATSLFAPWP